VKLLPLAVIVSIVYSAVVGLYYFNDIRFLPVVVQSIINFKLFVYFALMVHLWHRAARHENSDVFFTQAFRYVIFISLLGVVANLVVPAEFIYSTYTYALERDRLIGFQFKPNDLALCLAFFSVALLYSRPVLKHDYFNWILLLCIAAFVLLTTSRTALIVLVLTYILYALTKRYYALLIFSTLIGLLSIFIRLESIQSSFMFAETLSNLSELINIKDSQYIRGIMVVLGWNILFDHFPVAFGAGSFGTTMSADSPVYNYLGVGVLSFFDTMEGIYDSNLASIFGEYGVMGTLIFVYFLQKMIGNFANGNRLIGGYIWTVIIVVSLTQPIINYQVNGINLLLALFVAFPVNRGGPACLDRFSALLSGSLAV